MPVVNQRTHIPEEECQYQCNNVTAIYIGIAHDDNFIIPEFINIQYAGSILFFNTDAKSSKHVLDFLVIINFMFERFFNIEDFTTQWKDRLKIPVTTLFGSTTGTVSLDKKKFT